MFGYVLAMFLTIINSTLCTVLWAEEGDYPFYMKLYPAFSFGRIIYNMTKACSETQCYTNFSLVDNETWSCIIYLWGMGIFYLLAGTYFNEIVK